MRNYRRQRVLFTLGLLSLTAAIILYMKHEKFRGNVRLYWKILTAYQWITSSSNKCDYLANAASNEGEIEVLLSQNTLHKRECNCECLELRRSLTNWPASKPKAFIYFLAWHNRLWQFLASLERLDQYFNDKYNYPVVIFHEEENKFTDYRDAIKSLTKSKVFFQTVKLSMPDFLPTNLTQRYCRWYLGYRHMCRFHSKGVYEEPIIQGFEYAWRLDDDSRITKPIDFDVFLDMRKNNATYGHVGKHRYDHQACIVDLWKMARHYAAKFHLNSSYFETERDGYCFQNNFEISKLSFWLSAKYQHFIDYIDRIGGIYYNRWGDAPIKAIAVMLFLHRNEVYDYKNISYIHQDFRVNS